jgi:carboxylesterase
MSKSDPDDDPNPPPVDTGEFFLDGSGLSVLLIHGLTGTPYEMRYLGERLNAAGMRVYGVRLAGHASEPQDLGAVTQAHWYESAVAGFERLRRYGDPNIVVGLSMGAILAARLAMDQREAVAGVVMLSPAFFLPLRLRTPLRLMNAVGRFADQVYFHKAEGADIHDTGARGIHPGNRLMPLKAALNLMELSDVVRPRLGEIVQPSLTIHSRRDHTCPFRKNLDFVMAHLGSVRKRAVVLEESFHVITVDSEKEHVAGEVLDFANQFRVRQEPIQAAGG